MPRFQGIRRLFRLDRGVDGVTAAVDDELRFHMESTVRDLEAQGMAPDAARGEAERRFGDVRLARERLASIDHDRVVEERRAEWWEGAWQDVRYAARGLRIKPGFTAAVVVTLGLGIGANAAMFGVVDRLLFRPPALMRDAARVNRVVFVRTIDGIEGFYTNFQYRRYLELRANTKSFDRVAGFYFGRQAVGLGENARQMNVGGVSASFFTFYDATPVLGRYFGPAEDSIPEGQPVAVLGYGYWQSEYGGRRDAIGERVVIGATSYAIIGVAPAELTALDGQPAAAFIPITAMGAEGGGRSDRAMYYRTYSFSWMEMITHRKPGVSAEAATADLTQAYQRSYVAQREMNPRVLPIEILKPHALATPVQRERGPRQGPDSKVAMWLAGVALIVLLVACANVANLLLARAFGRRREIAVRLALGVRRGRLLGQLLTESVLLAALGGVAGLLVAQVGGTVLRALFLPDVRWTSALIDARTLAFTAAAALVAGLLAGLAPALHAGRGDLTSSLKAGVREGTFQRSRLRSGLLVLQGALSVVLLVGAGLFVRSLQKVHAVPLGYDPDKLIYLDADMRSTTLAPEALEALKNQLRDRAAQLPGVENATRAMTVPFWQSMDLDLYVPGVDSVGRIGRFALQAGSPEYFKTVGTRIVRGRGIERSDTRNAPLVIVVSEAMAKGLWPKEDPMGKCVKINADTMPCRYVVGVAEDIRRESLNEDPGLQYYLPIDQRQPHRGGFFVRTRDAAAPHAEQVRRELQKLMPGDAYLQARPMSEIVGPMMRSWQLGATLFVAFGGLALILASIGLYSVIAYNVAQRMHEIGVRVALGAQARDVAKLVLGQGLRVAVIGLALGAAAAVWAGKFVEKLLFNQTPNDPLVYAVVTASLLVAAIVASVLPAMRAVRIDPVTALRSD